MRRFGSRVVLLLGCVSAASGFSGAALPKFGVHSLHTLHRLVMQQKPVKAPSWFKPPEPKPLTATGDWKGLLTASLALGLRFGAGLTVTGWSPRLSPSPPEPGEYSLKLGPLGYLTDTSAVIRSECPRPKGRLILYEFDSSPYCRKVRDAMTALDLEVFCRPCPGALPGGKFSDELLARTGRRTVPYLIDEGKGVEMFGTASHIHIYTRPDTHAHTHEHDARAYTHTLYNETVLIISSPL